MAKIALTDGSGAWFEQESAVYFHEATYWDGHNHISKATGSQWDHEAVVWTSLGGWVINRWSQWQGSTETYEQIGQNEAICWLSTQEAWDDENFDLLPEAVRREVKAAIAELEI